MKKLLFLVAIVTFLGTTVSANVSITPDNSSIVIVDNDNDMDNGFDLEKDKDKDKKKKKKSKRRSKNCGDAPSAKKCGGETVDPGCKGAAKSGKSCCPPGGSSKKRAPAKTE